MMLKMIKIRHLENAKRCVTKPTSYEYSKYPNLVSEIECKSVWNSHGKEENGEMFCTPDSCCNSFHTVADKIPGDVLCCQIAIILKLKAFHQTA